MSRKQQSAIHNPHFAIDIRRRWPALAGAAAVIVAVVAAYWNSFGGSLIFDDREFILKNPNIGKLWPPAEALDHLCAAMRPTVDFSLTLNCILSQAVDSGLDAHRHPPGYHEWSYHAVNLIVHLLAALTLMGIVRRTLLSPPLRDKFGKAADWLAPAVAVLWAAHPVQTESVTYIIQRAESLMGLFYLLTLYCVIRGAGPSPGSREGEKGGGGEGATQSQKVRYHSPGLPLPHSPPPRLPPSPHPRLWYALAVMACALGMGSKQVMVTAPLVVLAYDRMFLARSFGELFRRRWGLYAGLAATWGIVIALLAVYPTGDSVGPALAKDGVTPVTYAATQFGVVAYYLRLAFWPYPQCLDYGWPLARTLTSVLPPAMLIAALLGLTAWAVAKGKPAGFAGLWFFLILAPTSTILPIKDLIFEHRMYLSLAGVVSLAVIGGYWLATRLATRGAGRRPDQYARTADSEQSEIRNPKSEMPLGVRIGGIAALTAIAAAFIVLTHLRNRAYADDVAMWSDVVATRGHHARGHYQFGKALSNLGDDLAAEARALADLGDNVAAASTMEEAKLRHRQSVDEYREAVRLDPSHADAHYNLANALTQMGQYGEAGRNYREAIRLRPAWAEPHDNYGNCLYLDQGLPNHLELAAEQYRLAISIDPGLASPHNNLGNTLVAMAAQASDPKAKESLVEEALGHFRLAMRLPKSAPNVLFVAHFNSFKALESINRPAEAMDEQAAAFAEQGKFPEAIKSAQSALQLARSRGQEQLAAEIQRRLDFYRAGKPYRQQ